MWIHTLNIANLRSIKSATFEFARGINILVGRNNSGKSTVLLPLLSLQEGLPALQNTDIRIGRSESTIGFQFVDSDSRFWSQSPSNVRFVYHPQHGYQPKATNATSQEMGLGKIKAEEPGNFIYPFVSKRKVVELQDEVSERTVTNVASTFQHLNAKIDRLSNPEFLPAHALYMRACDDILGFRITAAHTNNGKRAVYTVKNMDNIPLLSMGDGVMNILGLVVNLAIAENQLFLIEEPENDVHPQALKKLLDLIIEKSVHNQFIVTTHSNIVVKRLGAAPDAKVFHLQNQFVDRMPITTVTEVKPSRDSRREVLAELGYAFGDDDLWSGWLFLEESSAEIIIREFLIPFFVPGLQQRLRTFSARTVSEVVPKFRDFNDLFVFLHLEPSYKNKVWVIVDGGSDESAIIEELRGRYASGNGWNPEMFRQFSRHDFEEYYPAKFSTGIAAALAIRDKESRRLAKKSLLEQVKAWIRDNTEEAKKELAASADEVIILLKMINERI